MENKIDCLTNDSEEKDRQLTAAKVSEKEKQFEIDNIVREYSDLEQKHGLLSTSYESIKEELNEATSKNAESRILLDGTEKELKDAKSSLQELDNQHKIIVEELTNKCKSEELEKTEAVKKMMLMEQAIHQVDFKVHLLLFYISNSKFQSFTKLIYDVIENKYVASSST